MQGSTPRTQPDHLVTVLVFRAIPGFSLVREVSANPSGSPAADPSRVRRVSPLDHSESRTLSVQKSRVCGRRTEENGPKSPIRLGFATTTGLDLRPQRHRGGRPPLDSCAPPRRPPPHTGASTAAPQCRNSAFVVEEPRRMRRNRRNASVLRPQLGWVFETSGTEVVAHRPPAVSRLNGLPPRWSPAEVVALHPSRAPAEAASHVVLERSGTGPRRCRLPHLSAETPRLWAKNRGECAEIAETPRFCDRNRGGE